MSPTEVDIPKPSEEALANTLATLRQMRAELAALQTRALKRTAPRALGVRDSIEDAEFDLKLLITVGRRLDYLIGKPEPIKPSDGDPDSNIADSRTGAGTSGGNPTYTGGSTPGTPLKPGGAHTFDCPNCGEKMQVTHLP